MTTTWKWQMHKLKVRDVMKLPQCHTAGESRGYAPTLQCMTVCVHLTCCHRTHQRFLIQNELKYFRREFILSFYRHLLWLLLARHVSGHRRYSHKWDRERPCRADDYILVDGWKNETSLSWPSVHQWIVYMNQEVTWTLQLWAAKLSALIINFIVIITRTMSFPCKHPSNRAQSLDS